MVLLVEGDIAFSRVMGDISVSSPRRPESVGVDCNLMVDLSSYPAPLILSGLAGLKNPAYSAATVSETSVFTLLGVSRSFKFKAPGYDILGWWGCFFRT